MRGRQIGGIVCLFIALLMGANAIAIISRDKGLDDASGLGVSRAVGTLLPGFVLLIVGVWLLKRPASLRERSRS
jgi:hypothetical protein